MQRKIDTWQDGRDTDSGWYARCRVGAAIDTASIDVTVGPEETEEAASKAALAKAEAELRKDLES